MCLEMCGLNQWSPTFLSQRAGQGLAILLRQEEQRGEGPHGTILNFWRQFSPYDNLRAF